MNDTSNQTPVVEMEAISKHFGGVHAVEEVSINLGLGTVVGVLGHNGAGKSCLIKMLSGVMQPNSGTIRLDGETIHMADPADARSHGIETIYQDLALANHLDAPSNLFLGRELRTRTGNLDRRRMAAEAKEVLQRLNPNFRNYSDPVASMSGGQRQVVAIARAIYFNARVVIMDEPMAALGPSESEMVANLIEQLRNEGVTILLISHDMHDVFRLCDRVMVMNNGYNVGNHPIEEVSQDDVLSLIIKGELPGDWQPRNKAA